MHTIKIEERSVIEIFAITDADIGKVNNPIIKIKIKEGEILSNHLELIVLLLKNKKARQPKDISQIRAGIKK